MPFLSFQTFLTYQISNLKDMQKASFAGNAADMGANPSCARGED
jgi:hypothetical protein